MNIKLVILAILVLGGISGFFWRREILAACGSFLMFEAPLEKADAIVVLAGGVPERILEAADLFKSGYAPRIVLTKGEEPENLDLLRSYDIPFLEGYEQNRQIALKLGIPQGAIKVLEPRVNSTFAEIELLNTYCQTEGIRSLILVTSKTHTRRASKIFDHVSDGKIRILPRTSRYDTFDPSSWWSSRRMVKEVLLEYQKLLHYYLIVMTGG